MASIRQLQAKVKTFEDFKKVVNIQKIVVMKEIAEKKKIIEQIKFRNRIFNNYMIDIYKKFNAFSKDWFNKSTTRTPVVRDLHFIMGNPPSDRVGEYAHKLFKEFAEKNHGANDLYIVIGNGLSKSLDDAGLNILHTMPDKAITEDATYQRIAYQVLRGFKDLMFISASFIYLNNMERRVVQENIFPFSPEKIEVNDSDKDLFTETEDILIATNIKHVSWMRDVESVGARISTTAIEMRVHRIMVEYRLSMKLRELQGLDDKEKNIQEEVEGIKLQMARVRKENVTNELLTNAVAFGALAEEEED